MSLNAMAAALAAPTDRDPLRPGGRAADPFTAFPTPPPAASGPLEKLLAFIPTETIVLYWLSVPAAKIVAKSAGLPADGWTWIDVGVLAILAGVVTPAMLGLTYLNRVIAAGPAAPSPRLPWWEMTAAGLSFFCWSFAVPGNPFIGDRPELLVIAWVGATMASALLGQLDPIVKGYRDGPPSR